MARATPYAAIGMGSTGTSKSAWGGTQAAAPTAGPGYPDIAGLFREALASLSNEGEQTYQAGKRRTLSDIAMQSINAGAANTLNLPAAGIAYDEANRAQFNTRLGEQRANILTGLGQTAAGIYGQNLGAQTQLQTAQLGANVDYSRQALDRYLGELRAGQSSGGGVYTGGSLSMGPRVA